MTDVFLAFIFSSILIIDFFAFVWICMKLSNNDSIRKREKLSQDKLFLIKKISNDPELSYEERLIRINDILN